MPDYEMFQSTRASEDARDASAGHVPHVNPWFQSTRASEDARDNLAARTRSHAILGFNPRARPRTRATHEAFHWGYPARFQSTRASEDARDRR